MDETAKERARRLALRDQERRARRGGEVFSGAAGGYGGEVGEKVPPEKPISAGNGLLVPSLIKAPKTTKPASPSKATASGGTSTAGAGNVPPSETDMSLLSPQKPPDSSAMSQRVLKERLRKDYENFRSQYPKLPDEYLLEVWRLKTEKQKFVQESAPGTTTNDANPSAGNDTSSEKKEAQATRSDEKSRKSEPFQRSVRFQDGDAAASEDQKFNVTASDHSYSVDNKMDLRSQSSPLNRTNLESFSISAEVGHNSSGRINGKERVSLDEYDSGDHDARNAGSVAPPGPAKIVKTSPIFPAQHTDENKEATNQNRERGSRTGAEVGTSETTEAVDERNNIGLAFPSASLEGATEVANRRKRARMTADYNAQLARQREEQLAQEYKMRDEADLSTTNKRFANGGSSSSSSGDARIQKEETAFGIGGASDDYARRRKEMAQEVASFNQLQKKAQRGQPLPSKDVNPITGVESAAPQQAAAKSIATGGSAAAIVEHLDRRSSYINADDGPAEPEANEEAVVPELNPHVDVAGILKKATVDAEENPGAFNAATPSPPDLQIGTASLGYFADHEAQPLQPPASAANPRRTGDTSGGDLSAGVGLVPSSLPHAAAAAAAGGSFLPDRAEETAAERKRLAQLTANYNKMEMLNRQLAMLEEASASSPRPMQESSNPFVPADKVAYKPPRAADQSAAAITTDVVDKSRDYDVEHITARGDGLLLKDREAEERVRKREQAILAADFNRRMALQKSAEMVASSPPQHPGANDCDGTSAQAPPKGSSTTTAGALAAEAQAKRHAAEVAAAAYNKRMIEQKHVAAQNKFLEEEYQRTASMNSNPATVTDQQVVDDYQKTISTINAKLSPLHGQYSPAARRGQLGGSGPQRHPLQDALNMVRSSDEHRDVVQAPGRDATDAVSRPGVSLSPPQPAPSAVPIGGVTTVERGRGDGLSGDPSFRGRTASTGSRSRYDPQVQEKRMQELEELYQKALVRGGGPDAAKMADDLYDKKHLLLSDRMQDEHAGADDAFNRRHPDLNTAMQESFAQRGRDLLTFYNAISPQAQPQNAVPPGFEPGDKLQRTAPQQLPRSGEPGAEDPQRGVEQDVYGAQNNIRVATATNTSINAAGDHGRSPSRFQEARRNPIAMAPAGTVPTVSAEERRRQELRDECAEYNRALLLMKDAKENNKSLHMFKNPLLESPEKVKAFASRAEQDLLRQRRHSGSPHKASAPPFATSASTHEAMAGPVVADLHQNNVVVPNYNKQVLVDPLQEKQMDAKRLKAVQYQAELAKQIEEKRRRKEEENRRKQAEDLAEEEKIRRAVAEEKAALDRLEDDRRQKLLDVNASNYQNRLSDNPRGPAARASQPKVSFDEGRGVDGADHSGVFRGDYDSGMNNRVGAGAGGRAKNIQHLESSFFSAAGPPDRDTSAVHNGSLLYQGTTTKEEENARKRERIAQQRRDLEAQMAEQTRSREEARQRELEAERREEERVRREIEAERLRYEEEVRRARPPMFDESAIAEAEDRSAGNMVSQQPQSSLQLLTESKNDRSEISTKKTPRSQMNSARIVVPPGQAEVSATRTPRVVLEQRGSPVMSGYSHNVQHVDQQRVQQPAERLQQVVEPLSARTPGTKLNTILDTHTEETSHIITEMMAQQQSFVKHLETQVQELRAQRDEARKVVHELRDQKLEEKADELKGLKEALIQQRGKPPPNFNLLSSNAGAAGGRPGGSFSSHYASSSGGLGPTLNPFASGSAGDLSSFQFSRLHNNINGAAGGFNQFGVPPGRYGAGVNQNNLDFQNLMNFPVTTTANGGTPMLQSSPRVEDRQTLNRRSMFEKSLAADSKLVDSDSLERTYKDPFGGQSHGASAAGAQQKSSLEELISYGENLQ